MANLFSKLFTRKAQQTTVWPISQPYSFHWVGNSVVWKDTGVRDAVAKVLTDVPVVAAIIQKKSESLCNGEIQVVNTKSGKPVRGEYKDIEKLLSNPNPIQTESQFRSQVYSYMQAFGYCPVLSIQPVGFAPSQLWVLPPQYTEIKEKQGFNPLTSTAPNDWIQSITFSYNGMQTTIDINSVYIFQDTTLSVKNYYLPQSRLTALSRPITNLSAYYDASCELMQNKGPRGILSNSAAGDLQRTPMTKGEKDKLQEAFKQRYGIMPDQSQLIITDAALSWQSMSYNVTELGLNESYKLDTFDICNGLSYPKDLLQLEGTTFNNVDAAEKKLYQDVIIPDSVNYCQQLMELIGTSKYGVSITMDFSHVEVLQQSEKEKADGMKAMTDAAKLQFDTYMITYNQFREMVGQPPISGKDKFKYELPEYGTATTTETTNTSGTQSNQV